MGVCIGHEPCPRCNSADNLARYEDGSAHCFTPDCTYFERANNDFKGVRSVTEKKATPLQYDGEFLQLGSRGIDKAQVKKYGVKTRPAGTVIFPYRNKDGDIVASKLRNPKKQFMYTGDKEKLELFGQSVFGTGGKYLTITEGEFDAMACRQMIGDYPVVSIHSSTMAKRDIKNNIDWVESYEKVYLCLDNDEAGRKATQEIAELLTPNKVYVVPLSEFKDANEYLLAGASQQFKTTWWGAKKYSPVDVVSFADAWDSYLESTHAKILPLPKSCGTLNSMLGGGIATGEITVVGANTSIGKTSFINDTIYSMLNESNVSVGYLGFETTVAEIVKSMIRLQEASALFSEEMGKKAFDDIGWKERLHILNHLGSLELSEMLQKVRNMIAAFDLDVFLIDPIQLGLQDLSNDSVKEFMDSILKVAKQTDCSFILVSHTRKPADDKPHSVSEYDLLGSSAINQVAFNTLLLSRDKMAEDENERNTTHIKLVKCRRTGNTGQAGYLRFDKETFHFKEVFLDTVTEGDDEWSVD
jgi:twinkle protein